MNNFLTSTFVAAVLVCFVWFDWDFCFQSTIGPSRSVWNHCGDCWMQMQLMMSLGPVTICCRCLNKSTSDRGPNINPMNRRILQPIWAVRLLFTKVWLVWFQESTNCFQVDDLTFWMVSIAGSRNDTTCRVICFWKAMIFQEFLKSTVSN